MAVTPDDFLSLGKTMEGKDGCSEIELRAAYRCAYYAVHHAAKEARSRLGLPEVRAKKGGAHADVEVSLEGAGTADVMQIVAQMRRLKRVRVDCDYHLQKNIDRGVLSMRLAEAEEAFASLNALGLPVVAQVQ